MEPVTLIDPGASTLLSGWNNQAKRGNAGALVYYRQSSSLRPVIDHIAWDVASIPGHVYRSSKSTGAMYTRQIRKQIQDDPRALKALIDQNEIEMVDHPIAAILEKPNRPIGRLNPLTRWGFFVAITSQLDLAGEAFILPIRQTRGDRGEPMELEPIPSTWVTIEGKGTSARWYIDHPDRGRMGPLDSSQLIYVRHPDPASPYGRSTGMGATLADEINIDESAAQYQAALLRNHGMPKVMIGIDGGEQPVEQKTIDKINEEWKQKFGGVSKAGGVHFFGRRISSTVIGYSPSDLDIDATRTSNGKRISQGFGYPREKLGDVDNSNRATIDGSEYVAAKNVIRPRLQLHEDWINGQLLPLFEPAGSTGVFYAFDSCMPEDHTREDQAVKDAPWALSVDEHRKRMGVEPTGDEDAGAVHMLPSSLVPTTLAGIGIQASASEYEPQDPAEIAQQEADALAQQSNNPPKNPGATPKPIGSTPAKPKPKKPKPKAVIESEEPSLRLLTASGEAASVVTKDARITRVLKAIERNTLRRRMTPVMRRELKIWLSQIAQDLGAEPSPQVMRALIHSFIADFSSARITGIERTTADRMRRSLAQGIAQNETSAGLEQRIARVLSVSGGRARVIAHAEVHRATNWASWQLQSKSGVVRERKWIIHPEASIAGTRDAHFAMANQIRAIDEPFESPSGATTMYPSGFGIAALDIGCNCETMIVTTAVTLSAAEAWRKNNARAFGFRRRMLQAVDAAFTELRVHALTALKRAESDGALV